MEDIELLRHLQFSFCVTFGCQLFVRVQSRLVKSMFRSLHFVQMSGEKEK